jgi:hypothetical protein
MLPQSAGGVPVTVLVHAGTDVGRAVSRTVMVMAGCRGFWLISAFEGIGMAHLCSGRDCDYGRGGLDVRDLGLRGAQVA